MSEMDDLLITSIPQATRLGVGAVIVTAGGHRGIVTQHNGVKYVFWASGPETKWRALPLLSAAGPPSDEEAAP